MNKLIENLNWRYAVKKFDAEKKVSNEDLNTLLNATNLTATSLGLQPYKIIVVENTDLKKEIYPIAFNQEQIITASHLILLCVRTDIDQKYVANYIEFLETERQLESGTLSAYQKVINDFLSDLNQKELEIWEGRQAYLALGNLLTSAAIMQIDTCPMEGFVPEKMDELLKLKEKNLKSVVMVAIGYRAEEDKYQLVKKVRLPLEKVVEVL